MKTRAHMAASAVLAILALAACTEDRGRDSPGLRTDFTEHGAVISPANGAGWAFQAAPSALGCDGALAPLGEAAPESRGDRTVYAHPGLDEWYVRSPRGVEQGFTLPAPPACRREGKRGVVIALGGGLPAVVAEDGREARLHDASGREVLRYADLHVVDAAGRELASSLEARGEGLAIRFDDTGAAYPVVVDPTMWAPQQVVLAPDGGDFGSAVAVSADTLLVGAPLQGNAGAAYVFTRSGTSWSLQQVLGPTGAASEKFFGGAVALQGDTALIGAAAQNVAYVFTRSGTTWAVAQQLAPCGGTGFGGSVALDGDTIVVGLTSLACVYVLAGGTWTLQQALADASLAGSSVTVAVSGDTAILGAPIAGTSAAGAALVFVRASGAWTLQQQLSPSSPPPGAGFGSGVAVDGDTAIAISFQGLSVFTRSGAAWTQTALLPPDEPLLHFEAVTLRGATVAALGATPPMSMTPVQGHLEVFAPDGGAPQQDLILGIATNAQPFSVAIDGATMVAGLAGGERAVVFTLQSSDGDPCTSPDTCTSGFCVDGVCCAVPSCPAAGPCNDAEQCQPGTGTCSMSPLHEGMPCPAADACTRDPVCKEGTCTGTAKVCSPPDECHEFGACDPSNGQCSTPAKPDGTSCTGGKTCLDGFCGGPPVASSSPSGKGCACDAAGGAPAGGALISWIALAMLRRRRRRAYPRTADRDRIDP